MTRRRLRSLAVLEWVNIPLQAVIWFGIIGLPVTVANIVGFALFAWLLVQGGAYWFVKGVQLRRRRPRPPGLGGFRALRTLNVVALLGGGAVVAYGAVRYPGAGSWPGLVFAILAVFEHVNYFHVQLMYDTRADVRRLRSSGLRRSHLAADLRAAR